MFQSYADLVDSRYDVKEKIGSGGMGYIYRAKDLITGMDVALKRVTVEGQKLSFQSMSDTSDFRLSLAREFRFLATLRHPHIISVLDYGFDAQKRPYYTMDLLRNAKNIVSYSKGLDLAPRVNLLIQMAQALAYLHRRGIIHRDLKPENVLVHKDAVKVLDFGLAIQTETSSEQEDMMVGTLGYMAPEIMFGEPPTRSSDLYALGVIAYEVLVGRHPFDLDNPTQLALDVVHLKPNFSNIDLDNRLLRLIERLLEKEPSARHARTIDVVSELAEAIDQPDLAETDLIRDSYIKAASFVGRNQEFSRLVGALNQTLGPKPAGSAWLIGGESGVGKSRLVEELRAMALVEGALVLVGQSLKTGLPFQMWRNVLNRLILSTPMANFELGVLKEILPNLEDHLDRIVPDVATIQGKAGLQRLAKTVTDVFREQQRPILLLLEDLHWADEGLTILKELVEHVSDLPLLIVATYRNDERPGLPQELTGMQNFVLERLDTNEIRDLSISILGEQVGSQRNVLSLLERETEGNVFFLVEVVRVLAEEAGKLSDIGTKTLPKSVFSGSMRTVIERRLNRLPLDAQPLLRLAAVFGREIDLKILKAIDPVTDYETWLITCSNAAILEANADTWRFSHDRMRDGILDMLAPEQVGKLNEMVAEAIEAVYPNDKSYAERLMYHWTLAANKSKESYYAYLAGQQAFLVSDYQQALELFARSASISRESTPARLFIDQGDIHYQLGNFKPARASLKMALKREMSDLDRVTVLTIMGDMSLEKGNYYRAQRMLEEALDLARQHGNQAHLARVLSSMGEVMLLLGKNDQAKTYLDESSKLARKIDDVNRLLYVMNQLGRLELARQQVTKAETLLEKAYFMAVSSNNSERATDLIDSLGMVALEKGELEHAEKRFLTAIETAYKLGMAHNLPLYVTNLARVRISRGQLANAQHDLHEALERALELDLIPWVLLVLTAYAEMFHQQDDRNRALRLLGLVRSHPAMHPVIERTVKQYIEAWGATRTEIDEATAYSSFEVEVTRLLGRPWQPDNN